MKKKAFIIALTGPSACGKTYITKKIIDFGEQLQQKDINFHPVRFYKYVTRPYRETEIIDKAKHLEIDVKSVKSIPNDCELVYRTYGDEYGLRIKELKTFLDKNISPIIVINDVRVVEELKREFVGQVLSLFIFREIIPDIETHKNANSLRGSSTEKKSIIRFEKAVALYRIFIENIFIFDRVILNVEYTDSKYKNIVHIQTENLIRGVINGKISLIKKIKKNPKLFIISGNAASGKDDIIKAANKMGRLQTDILRKFSSRWQEADDENEIICKYIPKRELMAKYYNEYVLEMEHFNSEYSFANYLKILKNTCLDKYNKKDLKFQSYCSFEEYCKAKYEIDKLVNEKNIKTAIERFWKKINQEQEKRSVSTSKNVLKKELSEDQYLYLRNDYFELNSEYLNLDKIKKNHLDQIKLEISKIADKTENKSFFIQHNGKDYILYENNNLYNNPVNYGFEICSVKRNLKKNNKHFVLTASLPNIFKICKEYFGEENVITAFTYSQISQEEHLKYSDVVMGQAKLKEYEDILRYANHIAEFDYALIYAETSLVNKTGNQKNELVDQMFRLFRVYNNSNKRA